MGRPEESRDGVGRSESEFNRGESHQKRQHNELHLHRR